VQRKNPAGAHLTFPSSLSFHCILAALWRGGDHSLFPALRRTGALATSAGGVSCIPLIGAASVATGLACAGAYQVSSKYIAPRLFPINSQVMSTPPPAPDEAENQSYRKKEGILRTDPHHIFPQEKTLQEWFKESGITIDDFCIEVELRLHRSGIHGKGGMKLISGRAGVTPGNYNRMWVEYMLMNPEAERADILGYALHLVEEFGLEGLEIVKYKR